MAVAQNQSQIICCGCGTLLFYPQGASNVRCALCNNVTPVPPAGTEMAQLECGGCRTLLMYIRGASSVQCSVCNTVNLAMQANQIAHVHCGGCGITLMYAYGAQSIKCAVCNFVTQARRRVCGVCLCCNTRGGLTCAYPANRIDAQGSGGAAGQGSSGAARVPQRQQMVVVENPPTVDDEGKLVSNMAVGVVAQNNKG